MVEKRVSEELEVSLDTGEQYQPIVGMATRVVRGGLWSLGGQGVMILASVLATPFIIRFLGSEAYGVLSLINVVIGYLIFSDLGMGAAATRFGADAHARGNDSEEAAIVWTSLLVGLVPAMLAAMLLILGARPLVERVLHLPEHFQATTIFALRLATVGFIARSIAGVINSSQLVRLRLDVYTMINAGSMVFQYCLVPFALFLEGGLIAAVGVISGVSVAAAIVHAVASLRLLPSLVWPTIRSTFVVPLVRYGGALAISALAGLMLVNTEKLFLTRFVSVQALAYYSVASYLAGLLAMVPGTMSQGLFPAFTKLHASPTPEPLQQLYNRALRGTVLGIAPAALLMYVFAQPFISVWAGAEFGRESVVPFYILVVGVIFNVMTYVPCCLFQAVGKTDVIARYRSAEVVPYVLGAGLLTYWFGIVGAALAASVRCIIDALLLFLAAGRSCRMPFSPIPGNRRSYFYAVSLLFVPVLLIGGAVATPAVRSGVTFIALAAYGTLVWARVLTEEERAWLHTILPRRRPMENSSKADK